MQDQIFDLRIKIKKYEDIFKNILESHEDIDQVKETVQYVMDFYINMDKVDEFKVPIFTGDRDTDALLEDERIAQNDELKTQQESLDRYRDTQSEIAEYDKKLSEKAESVWRDTVLHPEFKSEYEEE